MDMRTSSTKNETSFECALSLDRAGAVASKIVLSADVLLIKRTGKDILLSAKQVTDITIGGNDIRIEAKGLSAILSGFGGKFASAAEAVSSWHKKGRCPDGLIHEKHLETFDEIEYEMSRRGRRTGSLRLFPSYASLTDSKNGKVKRIPYTYIRDILDEGHGVNIRMLKGPDVAISMLGRKKDVLLNRIPELSSALAADVAGLVNRFTPPGSDEGQAQAQAIFTDGRAMLAKAVLEKNPTLYDSIMHKAGESGITPIIGRADDLAMGFKKGSSGVPGGDCFFMVARLGDFAVISTFSFEERHTDASYIFRHEAKDFQSFIDDLSWSLTNVGYRWELLYIDAEKLKCPGYEVYVKTIEDNQEINRIRALYTGSIPHAGHEDWVGEVLRFVGKQ